MSITSCGTPFILFVRANGVNPQAYSILVEYIVDALRPSSNILANSFVQLATDISTQIILSILVIIFIIILIIVILLLIEGYIYPIAAICIIIVSLALLAIYYTVGYTYSKMANESIALPLQEDLTDTVLLTTNSILRDIIYLSLCR